MPKWIFQKPSTDQQGVCLHGHFSTGTFQHGNFSAQGIFWHWDISAQGYLGTIDVSTQGHYGTGTF